MAFALLKTQSILITNVLGGLYTFMGAAYTIKSVRLTNTSGSTVTGVTLYFDYDGTSTNPVDRVLSSVDLLANESVILDGGPWNFDAGGRISGVADTTNVVNLHFTPATI